MNATRLPGSTVLQIVPSMAEDHGSRAALDVAHALLRSGARAIIAGSDGALVSELQGLGGEWIALDSATTNPFRIRANANAIAKLIETEKIDIVHARGAQALRSAALARARTPTCLLAGFAREFSSPMHFDRAYARALAAADRVLVHSRCLASFAINAYKLSPGKVVIVPRRIDTQRFSPAAISRERAAVLRRSWKVQPGDTAILVPGRIDPAKGQLVIAETARILVNGGLRRTAFILAGNTRVHANYVRALNERARAHGVGEWIHLIGICSDMPAAYAAADLVLIPSIEPPTFGRVAVEALAMGRPIVASAVGALPEFVRAPPHVPPGARTGWLAKPDDPVDLARALAAALAVDSATSRAMSIRARHLAETLFSPGHVAAATLDVYTSFLEGRA